MPQKEAEGEDQGAECGRRGKFVEARVLAQRDQAHRRGMGRKGNSGQQEVTPEASMPGRASPWAVSRSAGNLVSQFPAAVGNLREVKHRVKEAKKSDLSSWNM